LRSGKRKQSLDRKKESSLFIISFVHSHCYVGEYTVHRFPAVCIVQCVLWRSSKWFCTNYFFEPSRPSRRPMDGIYDHFSPSFNGKGLKGEGGTVCPKAAGTRPRSHVRGCVSGQGEARPGLSRRTRGLACTRAGGKKMLSRHHHLLFSSLARLRRWAIG